MSFSYCSHLGCIFSAVDNVHTFFMWVEGGRLGEELCSCEADVASQLQIILSTQSESQEVVSGSFACGLPLCLQPQMYKC